MMKTIRPTRRALGAGRHRPLYLLVAIYSLLAAGLRAQDPLHLLSSSVQALVKRVSPSVVQVLVTGYGASEEAGRGETGTVIERQRSLASGVIVDPEGYIMTNAHVVKGAQRVQVTVPPPTGDLPPIRSLNARGRTLEARVVGIAEEIDLALLKIDAHGLPALPMGNYDKLQQGEMVFAFGSPEGLQNSVTMGLVSAVARQPDPDSPMIFIQTDASINPGNSGGPLVNIDGELVGINTFILTQSGGNEGLGFAIPSAVVGFAYPQLKKYGHVHRGEIGTTVQTITPDLAAALNLAKDSGVVVSDVLPGSTAEKAGLKIQDIIVSVDGRPVESLPLFTYSLFVHGPGDRVKLSVLRGSARLQMEVPVNERQHGVDQLVNLADAEKNVVRRLGILGIEIDSKIAALMPSLRQPSGVIVAATAAGAGGPETSLTPGDVIHALNGSPITSLGGLRSGLDVLKPGSPVALQIERDGMLQFITFQLE
jgi:serine protease Do